MQGCREKKIKNVEEDRQKNNLSLSILMLFCFKSKDKNVKSQWDSQDVI